MCLSPWALGQPLELLAALGTLAPLDRDQGLSRVAMVELGCSWRGEETLGFKGEVFRMLWRVGRRSPGRAVPLPQ